VTTIGNAPVNGSQGFGEGSYSTQVSYTSTFNGIQEGMLAVYENNAGLSAENRSVVMVKVLLNPEPGVTLGPVPGPSSVSDPSYWTQFVTAPPTIRAAYSVSFGHLMGNTSLQAVVVATDILGGGPVYRGIFVFDKIIAPHPQLLFQLDRLLHGNAQISGYSTVMTAQVDIHSSINTGKLEAGLTTDLFREFKWSDGAGTFVPTAFPGLFPDLTRWQAEADQHAVNTGSAAWKTNAVQVAQRMAAQLLQWPVTSPASTVSGGSGQDVDAVVQVKGPNPGGMAVNVTLSRLEGNTSHMWVVIGVTSGNGVLTITTPVKGDRLTSPTTITGTGSAFEGVIGRAFILDHLYTAIGQAQVKGGSHGLTTYTVTLPYTSSFLSGTQEGIVVVYMYSLANGSIATAAMQKVMIGA
jgi:Immunoglobulin-like domain of bacterial spore germination